MTPEQLRAWIAAAGGRRFLMCMGAHFINTALFVFGVLSESGYLTTFMGTVAVYVGASTYQKAKELKSD
jgi:hypothetical protein